MLKIKDSVDLKELEKYEFKLTYDTEWYKFNIDDRTDLFVKPLSREIIFRNYPNLTRDANNISVLYDLIKADMVEKVEE